MTGMHFEPEVSGALNLPCPCFQQAEHPAVLIVFRVEPQLLDLQLPGQQGFVPHRQGVADTLRQEA